MSHMLKMLFTIVDRGKGAVAADLLRQCGVMEHCIVLGNGTAHKDMLGILGLTDTPKDVLISFISEQISKQALPRLSYALDMDRPGKGIAFTVRINGVAGPKTLARLTGEQTPDTAAGEDTVMPENKNDLIIAIVNRGFTDTVMEAARPAGARGGTIIHGRGAGSKEAARFLGITIAPEKELVLILVDSEHRNPVMQAIARAAGLNSEGQGLVFSLPAGDVMGVARGQDYTEAAK